MITHNIIYILVSQVATISTNLCIRKNKLNSIQSSTITTLIFYTLLLSINYYHSIEINKLLTIFFGATFVGMSSPQKISFFELFISSLLFTLLFIFLIPLLSGIGGALGLSAFLSVFKVNSVKKIIWKFR